MFTILNDKNVSTYLIRDFMSLKCLSRLLYMEPRESGSYSVPSFLSTHRMNLAILLSWSLGYLSRCSFLTNRSEKVGDHFHVTFCLCLKCFYLNFLLKKTTIFFICYHTKPFAWYDIFFLIVGILVQVC